MISPSHQRQTRDCASYDNGTESQPLSHPPFPIATNGTLDDDGLDSSSIPSHPLGIKPLGNKYFSGGGDARRSMGVLQILPDEMLMQLLEYLDQRTLRLFGYTCKFLFACCVSDDIWKTIYLE